MHTSVLFIGTAKSPYSTPFIYNYWGDLYHIYMFYALHIHNLTYVPNLMKIGSEVVIRLKQIVVSNIPLLLCKDINIINFFFVCSRGLMASY